MAENHVCPVWIGYLLASPLRKLFQNPEKILAPFVKKGMTVMDIGSAMGFFSIPMAKMVGSNGKVISVDLQEKMLTSLKKKATKAGLENRIETRLCQNDTLAIDDFEEKIDLVLAFAVVHEVPDTRAFFTEIYPVLKKGGTLLVAEPKGHVSDDDFKVTLGIANDVGFKLVDNPGIHKSRTAVLQK